MIKQYHCVCQCPSNNNPNTRGTSQGSFLPATSWTTFNRRSAYRDSCQNVHYGRNARDCFWSCAKQLKLSQEAFQYGENLDRLELIATREQNARDRSTRPEPRRNQAGNSGCTHEAHQGHHPKLFRGKCAFGPFSLGANESSTIKRCG